MASKVGSRRLDIKLYKQTYAELKPEKILNKITISLKKFSANKIQSHGKSPKNPKHTQIGLIVNQPGHPLNEINL